MGFASFSYTKPADLETHLTRLEDMDDEPMPSSEKLVKSGGVYKELLGIIENGNIFTVNYDATLFTKIGRYVSGVYSDNTSFKATELIPITPGSDVSAYLGAAGNSAVDAVTFFDINKKYLSRVASASSLSLSTYESSVPSNAYFVAFTHFNTGSYVDKETATLTINSDSLVQLKRYSDAHTQAIESINSDYINGFAFGRLFSVFDNYSVTQDRYITSNGAQGNANWCNLYSFITEKGKTYAIYGTSLNTYLPICYFDSTPYPSSNKRIFYFIQGDGSIAYINSLPDTLEVYVMSIVSNIPETLDDVPTDGSAHSVKSGGVYDSIMNLISGSSGITISGTNVQFTKTGRYVSGTYSNTDSFKATELIPIEQGDNVIAHLGSAGNSAVDAITYFDSDKHYLSRVGMSSTVSLSDYESVAPANAKYVAFTHFNSGSYIDKETYSIELEYYSLSSIKTHIDNIISNSSGKFAFTELFKTFTDYSVQENRYITSQGIQGNNDTWCNLYMFTTEANRIYAIYGTAGNSTLPLAYYKNEAITNPYNGKLTFIVGDGSVIYINSKAETLEVYEFIMAGSSDDVAISHEVNILQTFDEIVCCGDSLTYGAVYYGSIAKQALSPYPKCLEKLTGCNVSSLAVGGYTTKNWWDNFNGQITGANKLYIIYLGTNGRLTDTIDTDCAGDDYSTYADNNTGCYGKIIKKIIDTGSMALLIGMESMQSSSTYTETIRTVKNFAVRFNVPVVVNPAIYLSDRYYHYAPGTESYNSVHLNNLGYAKFASILVNTINSLPISEQFKLQPIQ